MSNESPLGSFEEQVLVGVLRAASEAYGMEVRREIERVTGREISIGSVYATLDRLEAKGLTDSDRDGSAGRRIFRVTPFGIEKLVECRAMRERLWQGVDLGGLAGAG